MLDQLPWAHRVRLATTQARLSRRDSLQSLGSDTAVEAGHATATAAPLSHGGLVGVMKKIGQTQGGWCWSRAM